MGLDIMTSDGEKNFHIGYIGFSNMRAFFILHYGEELYKNYNEILRAPMRWDVHLDKLFEEICEKIGDLSIIIDHSDCDGELTSDECKKLLPSLIVDENKIKSMENYDNNPKYFERIIKLMYEFIDIIDYCAKDDGVKLIFG